jgi:hypothetical protein
MIEFVKTYGWIGAAQIALLACLAILAGGSVVERHWRMSRVRPKPGGES